MPTYALARLSLLFAYCYVNLPHIALIIFRHYILDEVHPHLVRRFSSHFEPAWGFRKALTRVVTQIVDSYLSESNLYAVLPCTQEFLPDSVAFDNGV